MTKGSSKATFAVKVKAKTPRMSPDEKRIAREMHFDRKMRPTDIAAALGRDLSSVCRLLAQKKAPQPIGRPKALTDSQIDHVVEVLEKMIDEADACYEVTLPMVMRRCRLTKHCERVVANALHKRGYWFRKLRSKMILTPDDVKARWGWSKQYKDKSSEWWRSKVQVHLDNHHFKVCTTSKGRKLLAKRRVRGVYRTKRKTLRPAHIKPDPKLRVQTGAKGFLKLGGVGGGKVLVWKTIHGQWSGAEAASAYKTVVAPALKAAFPGKTTTPPENK